MTSPFKFDFKENLPKALLSGATYSAGTMLVFPADISATVPIFGTNVPVMGLSFAAGVAGSLAGDLAASILFPLVPFNERIKKGSTALVDGIISGAVECSILRIAAGVPMQNIPKLLGYSITHNMGNEWLWASIVSKEGFDILGY